MDLGLNQKVVVVGGGAGPRGSIGETLIGALVEEGAIPVVLDVSERGRAYADAIRAGGREALFVQTDLTDPQAVEAAVGITHEAYGRIDVVVNNVGLNDGVGLDANPEAFARSLRLNLMPYWLLVKYSYPLLKANRGNVLSVGSKVALTGQGNTNGYAAAKGGVLALTREWAVDFAPHGMRANALVIAECWTPAYRNWLDTLPDGKDRLQSILNRIPLGNRMTTVREIADTALFLISDRASHTTGQYVHVDGGYVHLDRSLPRWPPAPPSGPSPAG